MKLVEILLVSSPVFFSHILDDAGIPRKKNREIGKALPNLSEKPSTFLPSVTSYIFKLKKLHFQLKDLLTKI